MRHARPVLIDDGEPLGALILYSRQPTAFGPKETGQAATFAGHASGALTLALRSVSQHTNVKLRDLAADIVTSVSGEPPRPASPFEDG